MLLCSSAAGTFQRWSSKKSTQYCCWRVLKSCMHTQKSVTLKTVLNSQRGKFVSIASPFFRINHCFINVSRYLFFLRVFFSPDRLVWFELHHQADRSFWTAHRQLSTVKAKWKLHRLCLVAVSFSSLIILSKRQNKNKFVAINAL